MSATAGFPSTSAKRPLLLDSVHHARHVAKGDRPALYFGDDERLITSDLRGFPGHAEWLLGALAVETADGEVDVFRPETADHIVDAETQRFEPLGEKFDRDLAERGPHEVDLADSLDILDAALDGFLRKIGQLARRQAVRPHRKRDDRERREVDLLDDRLVDVIGELVADRASP